MGDKICLGCIYKIGKWELIFGWAEKAISSQGVCSPCWKGITFSLKPGQFLSKNLTNFVFKYWYSTTEVMLKVTFSQKGLMGSSFLQTDEPNYFSELDFWFFFSFWITQIMSNMDMKLLWMLKKGIKAALSPYLAWFEPFRM